MAVGVFLPQSRRKKKSKKTTKVQLMRQKLGMLKENMTSIYIYIFRWMTPNHSKIYVVVSFPSINMRFIRVPGIYLYIYIYTYT